jgi:hypothetical protein
MKYNEFLTKLSSEKFVVYGAGSYGKKFVASIKKRGLEDNFWGFAVTDNTGMPSEIRNIREFDRNTLIVIAAHGAINKAMKELLVREGFGNVVDAEPYLFELLCGEPVKTDVEIDVKSFVKKCKATDGIALRWLAIDYVLGKNDYGKAMLIKHYQNRTAEMSTVKARWDFFVERVRKYQTGGAPENYNIKIVLSDGFVIDGIHRLTLAYYFEIPKINADIYDFDWRKYIQIFKLTEDGEEAIEEALSAEEYRIVQEKRKEIFGYD